MKNNEPGSSHIHARTAFKNVQILVKILVKL